MDAEELQYALKDAASLSKKTTGCSGGWTSSEDEADPMDHEEEGFFTIDFKLSFSHSILKLFYFPLSWLAFLFTALSFMRYKLEQKSLSV